MAFVHDFQAVVIPKMRAEAFIQAIRVALDEIEFGDARHEVAMIAIRGGVGLLKIEHHEAVLDRIPDLIWDAYEAALLLLKADETRRMMFPVPYYDDLVSKAAKPDQLKWVFAALSKPYRKALLERANGR